MRQALDPGWLVLNIANLTLKIVQTIKTCGVECRKMKPLFRAEIMEKADTMELKSLERDAALLVLEKMKCRECDTEDLCNGEGVEEGLEDNDGGNSRFKSNKKKDNQAASSATRVMLLGCKLFQSCFS